MKTKELHVVCFYWLGDRWGEGDRGPEYINKLYRGVARNLSVPFRFCCFTNEPIADQLDSGIEVKPFRFPAYEGAGVLPRLYMFNLESGLLPESFVLALDLDVVIVGSLDEIVSYKGAFCVRSKFAPGQQWKADGDIIGFRPSLRFQHIFWDSFLADYDTALRRTGGRERYWFRHIISSYFYGGDCDRWQNECPGQVVSYKRHVKRTHRLPENARIVSCHGRPRPHELTDKWAKNHWR